jgi:hypothetical protein
VLHGGAGHRTEVVGEVASRPDDKQAGGGLAHQLVRVSADQPGDDREVRGVLRVAREGFGADMPRILLLDVDGAREWWPINKVTRTGVPPRVGRSVPCG